MNESALNTKAKWYFGNNRTRNLRLSPPAWYAPFFLTTNYSYAEDYSDYGVYSIDLKTQAKAKILDFSKPRDTNKLKWPVLLISTIKSGKSDLNSIAYDLYKIAFKTGEKISYIQDNDAWKDVASYFKSRSNSILRNIPGTSNWGSDKDHQFILRMWKDIYDAGFDGFMQIEFGNEILALFTLTSIDKISINPVSRIIDENKASYLKRHQNEPDVKELLNQFWALKNRIKAPMNDIDWWIKKPYADFKKFVQTYDLSNKRDRKESNYKYEAQAHGARMLDVRDGYEIWYVPTYDAMRILGRFYKGRSAKWCVASDDPSFWFDNHDDDEFMLLIREHPKHDEFDKIALQMEQHGRYYNEDSIIPWDLENNDWTFDRGVIDNSEELVHYAWILFKNSGELRDNY